MTLGGGEGGGEGGGMGGGMGGGEGGVIAASQRDRSVRGVIAA